MKYLQSFRAVERAFPGFTAFAGPFNTSTEDPKVKAKNEAQRDSALANQLQQYPDAKIVSHGPREWVIRKNPLSTSAAERVKSMTSGKLGVKAGRGGAKG